MERKPVKSSTVKSIGHGPEGTEIEIHQVTCGMRKKSKVPTDEDPTCNCGPGQVWLYPKSTTEDHQSLTGADSIGRHFATDFLRKHKESGIRIHPPAGVEENLKK